MNLRDDDLNNFCIVAHCISVCVSTRVNWIFFTWGLCNCTYGYASNLGNKSIRMYDERKSRMTREVNELDGVEGFMQVT